MRSTVWKKEAWAVLKLVKGSEEMEVGSSGLSRMRTSPGESLLLLWLLEEEGGVARARIAEERWVRREAMSYGGWISDSKGMEEERREGADIVDLAELLDPLGWGEGLVDVDCCCPAVVDVGRLR